MATKVICDRCGKEVEHSKTQIAIKVHRIVGNELIINIEKDYCVNCYGIVMAEVETIVNEEI